MVLGRGKSQRLWPHLPVRIKNMAPFIDAPPKIVPFANEIDLLPQILAVVADPDMTRSGIDRQPPGISQAVSPGLWHDAFVTDEGIIWRHAVVFAIRRMIDIDPQDFAREPCQVLAAE